NAREVVDAAWKSAGRGEVISVPGFQYKILSFLSQYAPRPLVRKLGMNVRVRQRSKK
ncbi:MAG: short-chain dehydrogenase, partial [Actinobacteria bacterium]|nr:short-chain dehydrogenase [Actinomycetota bacterium]